MAARPPTTVQRSSRIDDTLQTLFESLVDLDGIDPNDTQSLAYAHSLVAKAKASVHQNGVAPPPNINQAQDLIKRKLLRENASPEKAARFSNLYSRLLGITVLSQKWAMLYLLHQIAGHSVADNHDALESMSRYGGQVVHSKERVLQHGREYADVSPPFARRTSVDEPSPVYPTKKSEFSRRPSLPVNSAIETSLSPSRDASKGPPRRRSPKREDGFNKTSNQNPVRTNQEDVRSTGRTFKSSQSMQQIPLELDLLRDLPYNLQGLSSGNIEFITSNTVKLPKSLPIPILSLLHTLAEPCLLYKELSEFTSAQSAGLVSQSLSAAVSIELRSYLSLVASLEGEIRGALTAIAKTDQDRRAMRAAGVTLKRCVVWMRDATMGLRLMSLIVEESQTKRGGQIITLIHGLSSANGDPFVGTFAEKILALVTKPFYDMLRRWIYDGELVDPYNEFFVVEADPNANIDVDRRRVATSIWQDKYILESDMIPTIISPEFAKKVFLIGKSLNFIRHNCGDSDWVIQYSQRHSKPLDYANTSSLFSSIDDAYQSTMSRLTYLMSDKFLLFTHLEAIKKYLLLSRGDFIELLVESLAPNLDRPAHSQYRHTLTSQLEHAIRHSNAQYEDSEVLKRLDARMLELGRGDTGWDCFTLEYKISAPCDVVITQWASTQYLKIFNLLFRIKRVEYSLNTTWRRCMTGARGVLATVGDTLNTDWKRARCNVAEMVHFVNQLQYYVLFEVIEASWKALQESVNKPNATLDDLIDAHTTYVKTITQKGLLASSGDREEAFLVQLHHILRCMLNYRDAVDGLYSYSVADFTRRQQFNAKIEQRTAAGKWGVSEKDQIADSPLWADKTVADSNDATQLSSIRSRLLQLSTEFKSRISVLLYDLAHQPDVDMRFLGVVMNFNEVYKPVNRRRRDRERERKETARDKTRTETSSVAAGTSMVGEQDDPVQRSFG